MGLIPLTFHANVESMSIYQQIRHGPAVQLKGQEPLTLVAVEPK